MNRRVNSFNLRDVNDTYHNEDDKISKLLYESPDKIAKSYGLRQPDNRTTSKLKYIKSNLIVRRIETTTKPIYDFEHLEPDYTDELHCIKCSLTSKDVNENLKDVPFVTFDVIGRPFSSVWVLVGPLHEIDFNRMDYIRVIDDAGCFSEIECEVDKIIPEFNCGVKTDKGFFIAIPSSYIDSSYAYGYIESCKLVTEISSLNSVKKKLMESMDNTQKLFGKVFPVNIDSLLKEEKKNFDELLAIKPSDYNKINLLVNYDYDYNISSLRIAIFDVLKKKYNVTTIYQT